MTESRISVAWGQEQGLELIAYRQKQNFWRGWNCSKVLSQQWLPDYIFSKIHQTTLKVGEFYGIYYTSIKFLKIPPLCSQKNGRCITSFLEIIKMNIFFSLHIILLFYLYFFFVAHFRILYLIYIISFANRCLLNVYYVPSTRRTEPLPEGLLPQSYRKC